MASNDWRRPAGNLPHASWDWNDPPSYMAECGALTIPTDQYPGAAQRGVILLWCDDAIVPPIGQLVAVGPPDDGGSCACQPIGPEFEVEDWEYEGRILTYEEAARCELDARTRAFVLNPSEYWLNHLMTHARHLHGCEISHPMLTRIVMLHARATARPTMPVDEQCATVRQGLLVDPESTP